LVRLAHRELPPAIAGRWTGLLRPGFWLRAAGGRETAVGQLGGVPVLPDGMAWPRWEGHGPLTFIAEIDCGQMPSDTLSLPRTGTLSFFVHNDLPVAPGDPAELAAARVVYIPAGAPAVERDAPAGVDSYDLVELTGELYATGPDLDSPVLTEALADLGGEDRAFLADRRNTYPFKQGLWELAPPPRHWVGGHALPIQTAVELEIAHAQLGGAVPYDDPALTREATHWTSLAQFDSDEAAGMMWGDCGTLYWLIRPGDLAARRFEAAAFAWQCT
jgi:hypothetical protein